MTDSQLATKLDLAKLKSDLLMWTAGMLVVQTGVLAGLVFTVAKLGS